MSSAILIVSKPVYDEIRRLLMIQGSAGHFDERGARRRIDLTGVVIQRETEEHRDSRSLAPIA